MSFTLHIPDDLASRLVALADERETTVDALAAEFLAEQVKPRKHRLSFAAIGASTSGKTAADAEEMLAEGFGRDSLRS